MSHGQIRTFIAIKPLNLLLFEIEIDVVACPSPATISPISLIITAATHAEERKDSITDAREIDCMKAWIHK
jgi:hypothetical protein